MKPLNLLTPSSTVGRWAAPSEQSEVKQSGARGGCWWREEVCDSCTFPTHISQLVCGLNWCSLITGFFCFKLLVSLDCERRIFKWLLVALPRVHFPLYIVYYTQYVLFLLCLSHSVEPRSKHVVTAFGCSSLNRCQLLEVSLSAWRAFNIEITSVQPMNMELLQASLDLNYWSVRFK